MQSLGRYYVQYFNYQYKRTGTLWEGRYKSTLLDSESYLLTCSRYIELNPVRAGMVDHPGEYRWSSYGSNALGHGNALITPHELYLRLGSSSEEQCEAYRHLFDAYIDEKSLADIREATNKSWVLGSGKFREQVEALTNAGLSQTERRGQKVKKVQRKRNRSTLTPLILAR